MFGLLSFRAVLIPASLRRQRLAIAQAAMMALSARLPCPFPGVVLFTVRALWSVLRWPFCLAS